MKPTFEINLDADGRGALAAADVLTHFIASSPSQAYKRALAIYNRSVSRICDKVTRTAVKLEARFGEEIALGISNLARQDDSEITDYLELVLYAAAEHTDDLKEIARETAGPRGVNPKNAADQLETRLKRARDRISMLTNKIKHHQWRITLLRQEFVHGAEMTILYGMSLNSVATDRVKLERLPPDGASIVAVPSLLWLVLEYLYAASTALADHLGGASVNAPPTEARSVASALAAVVRLPNYTFDEEHTTKRVRILVHASAAETQSKLTSSLYGAWKRRWDLTANGRPGRSSVALPGDGANRSFDFPTPTKVSLVHWDA